MRKEGVAYRIVDRSSNYPLPSALIPRIILNFLCVSMCIFNLAKPASAVYYCPTIIPASGSLGYVGTDAAITLDSRCVFQDDNLGTTSFETYLAPMATAAARTVGKTARVSMVGAYFNTGATVNILGYYDGTTFEPADDVPSALKGISFKFLMQNCDFLHPQSALIGVQFFGLFPPKTNITITGNTYQAVLSSSPIVGPSGYGELFTMFLFLVNKIYDNSIIAVERNELIYVIQIAQRIPFDKAEFQQEVADRHNSADPSEGVLFQKVISSIYFGGIIQVLDSSTIRISENYFYSQGNLTISDPELSIVLHAPIIFEDDLSLERGSQVDISQNGGTSQLHLELNNIHGLDRVFTAFIYNSFSVSMHESSGITVSQNYYVMNINQSAFMSDVYDPLAEQGHSQLNEFIFFGYVTGINSSSYIVIALNVISTAFRATTTPVDSDILSSVVSTFVQHGATYITFNSHYLVHGNIVLTTVHTNLNSYGASSVNFVRFESGIGASESSRVLVGCVNPFPSPERSVNIRVNVPTYSDIYEQFNPKRAKEWNGPLMNRSSFDYIQTHYGNDGTTLTDANLLGSGSNINYKCYTNYVRLTSYQDRKGPSTSSLNFFFIYELDVLILNGSLIGAINNLVSLTAYSAYDDSPIIFLYVYLQGSTALRNQLYNGQIVIASNMEGVPTSKINIDPDFLPPGSYYDIDSKEEELALRKYDMPSCFAISDNDVQKEYAIAMTGPHFMNAISSKYGMWIKDGSMLLMTNNVVAMLALPPSATHKVRAGQTSVSPYFDPASPSYDPYFDWKNMSEGAFSFLVTDDMYIANPKGFITITRNAVAFLDGASYAPEQNNTLNMIPFSGYPNASSGQFDKSYWGMSQAEMKTLQASTPMIDGRPVTFVMRPGPPLIRPFEWSTNYSVDVWQGGPVKRYPNPQSMIALLKNETPLIMTPNTSLMPWANDLRINYCGNRVNSVEVESAEVMSLYKTLVNFRGLSLNKDLGTEATDGVGLEIYGCPVPPTQTVSLSSTSTVSTSSSYMPTSSRIKLSTFSAHNTMTTSLKRTQTQSITRSLIQIAYQPQPQVESSSKVALDTSSSALGGVVATVGAALGGSSLGQITISNAIIRMSSCINKYEKDAGVDEDGDGDPTNDGEDDLPIMVHPLRFSIDKSYPLHQERGAIVGNAIVTFVAVAFVRFVAVFVAGKFINANEDSRLIVGWPSAFTLPFVALVEGTTTCATRLLNDLSADDEDGDDIALPSNVTRFGKVDGLPTSIRALNYFLGFATFLVMGLVSCWWAYFIAAKIPKQYMRRVKQQHRSWIKWLSEPRFEWEYHISEEEKCLLDKNKNTLSPVAVGGATGGIVVDPTALYNISAIADDYSNNGSIISLKLHQAFVEGKATDTRTEEDTDPPAAAKVIDRMEHHTTDIVHTNDPQSSDHSSPSPSEVLPLSEVQVMSTLHRFSHLYGDKYFLCIELLCFVSAMAVGISEGLADTKCRSKITVASVAALAQVFFNLSSTVPLDLLVQSLLGLCTATLTAVALVRVYSNEAVDLPLEEGMEYVGTIGNVLGLIAIVIALFGVIHRLFRARRIARAVELRRLREHFASTANKKYDELEAKGARVEQTMDDDLDIIPDEHPHPRAAQKKKLKSTANQVFEVKFDLGEDLDLFLLDVEEAAMNTVEKRNRAAGGAPEVDELDIEMAVVGVGEDLSLAKAYNGRPTVEYPLPISEDMNWNSIVQGVNNNFSFSLATTETATPVASAPKPSRVKPRRTRVHGNKPGSWQEDEPDDL